MLKPYFDKFFPEAGCDEAGRGCLAGPVFAAAVILPRNCFALRELKEADDSKKLSDAMRRKLRPLIEKTALSFAVAMATVEEIDRINILNASFLAMHRAIAKLKIEPKLLLIDGNRFAQYYSSSGKKIAHRCIIDGDAKYLSIACASVLAKTYRDDYMLRLHEQFPHYGWKNNKGYATREHRWVIEHKGTCEHHRKSFTLISPQGKIDFNRAEK